MGPWRAHLYHFQHPFSRTNNQVHTGSGRARKRIWRSRSQAWRTQSITHWHRPSKWQHGFCCTLFRLQFLRIVTVCKPKLLLKHFDNWQDRGKLQRKRQSQVSARAIASITFESFPYETLIHPPQMYLFTEMNISCSDGTFQRELINEN